ncbi:MAG: type I 3-dehydroquinate dehydratase [Erysipelotrichaceae bacterium]|nr:type I 3-dehydroquinate dehydratase [Erysipelotrichaceae bacterium]
MKVCQVRNIKIGEGKPKICLPIVGTTDDEIMAQLASFETLKYDLIELRIDFYKDIHDIKKVLSLLRDIRVNTAKPILFTCRSKKEGGEIELDKEEYKDLIREVLLARCIDMVDIEVSGSDYIITLLIGIAHRNNVKVIMSNHDFEKTPDNDVLIERLQKMEKYDADIAKIAVMPQSKEDVIRLINLTMEMDVQLDIPLVTMSMGELGVISRITGELTGSSITFATGVKASAPGQINVNDMNIILEVLHHD